MHVRTERLKERKTPIRDCVWESSRIALLGPNGSEVRFLSRSGPLSGGGGNTSLRWTAAACQSHRLPHQHQEGGREEDLGGGVDFPLY